MRLARFLIPALIVLLAAGASVVTWRGCASRSSDPAFTPAERALVQDLLALYRLRITRLQDPERAVSVLDSLDLHLDEAALERELDQLGADPHRGIFLLRAVHDSLDALRDELFPPAQGMNRAGERARETATER